MHVEAYGRHMEAYGRHAEACRHRSAGDVVTGFASAGAAFSLDLRRHLAFDRPMVYRNLSYRALQGRGKSPLGARQSSSALVAPPTSAERSELRTSRRSDEDRRALFERAREVRHGLRGAALLATFTGAALLGAPSPAEACGGLFCDNAPMPMPVDQTGENILFVMDPAAGKVEAHIQIQYTGEPEKFAWVIPVQAIPDFSAGSEVLFSNLLAGTAPVYSLQTVFDCESNEGSGLGCGGLALSSGDFAEGASSAGGGFDTDDGQQGPTIVKREIVGAFEIVVLQGGTSQELVDWLDDNGYAQDPEARPILEEYLAEGYYFAAAKLLHGAGVDELQPLVLSYDGTQPCVPLRLTRIAAADDMPIRIFTLADGRAVPTGYKHVELNQVLLDWANSASNYFDVVIQAIDEAGGLAFITEYASTSDVVTRDGLFDERWDPSIFIGVEEPILGANYTVIDALTTQGLMECFDSAGCSYDHPMLLPILRNYLPSPPGVAEEDFYGCIECFESSIDLVAWDGDKFAAALAERIVLPGSHAVELLNTWPALTRMLTIMSPHEMLADPEFVQNPDLPTVEPSHSATQMIPCEGSNKVVFDDGRELLLNLDSTWPALADMPFAERIEVMAPAGAPQVELDNKTTIDDLVRASNRRFDYDNGSSINCALRSRSSLGGALTLGLVFAFAWRTRRRRR